MSKTKSNTASKTIDWDRVDWTRPARSLAKELGCSCQRVYQVIKKRGIKRKEPTKEERFLRIKTEKYTVRELALRFQCSADQLAVMLRKTGKVCKVSNRYAMTDSEPFKQWLIEVRKYPVRVAGNIISRCGKVERAYGVKLITSMKREAAFKRVLDDMSSSPEKLLRQGSKRNSLAGYRFSVKCYHEFCSIKMD